VSFRAGAAAGGRAGAAVGVEFRAVVEAGAGLAVGVAVEFTAEDAVLIGNCAALIAGPA
jgi:hypothetical protein